MPQARGRSKGLVTKRQENQPGIQSNGTGRTSESKGVSKSQQKDAGARGQQGKQGAREQHVKTQNAPPQQKRNRDEGPKSNSRYGNGNNVAPGIEDADSHGVSDRKAGRNSSKQRSKGEGFENARGEYSNFNVNGRKLDDDNEMNDYTDARLGSNVPRGRKSSETRAKQGQPTGKGRVSQPTSTTRRQPKSGRGSR